MRRNFVLKYCFKKDFILKIHFDDSKQTLRVKNYFFGDFLSRQWFYGEFFQKYRFKEGFFKVCWPPWSFFYKFLILKVIHHTASYIILKVLYYSSREQWKKLFKNYPDKSRLMATQIMALVKYPQNSKIHCTLYLRY